MLTIASDIYKFMILGTFISCCCQEISGASTLKAVSMLTRHGDRSPDYSYESDPYANFPWPGGFGALSPRGVRQLYQSGMIKSNRYSSLLTPSCSFCNYDLNKIYVKSSEFPRCIESAKSFLDGFLPNVYPESLINVTPKGADEFLGFGKPCQNYDYIRSNWFNLSNPDFAEVIDFQSDAGKELLANVEYNTGRVGGTVFFLVDILKVELENDLALPEWAENIYDRYLEPIASIGMNAYGKSRYMQIRSGTFLKDIVERLQSFVSGSSIQNIIFYSGHDSNVIGMLYLLDVRDQIGGSPMYGSMLNMEIYDNSDVADDFEIKIVYFRMYGDENPIVLDIPNCSAPCPFRKFHETVESKLIFDHDEECSH